MVWRRRLPQCADWAGGNAAVERMPHGRVHANVEGCFHRNVETAVAKGQSWLDLLSRRDADAATASNTLARFVYQPAGVMLSFHFFACSSPVQVAVDLVRLRIGAQGTRELFAAVTL